MTAVSRAAKVLIGMEIEGRLAGGRGQQRTKIARHIEKGLLQGGQKVREQWGPFSVINF
jgi:hypothetical protein